MYSFRLCFFSASEKPNGCLKALAPHNFEALADTYGRKTYVFYEWATLFLSIKNLLRTHCIFAISYSSIFVTIVGNDMKGVHNYG